mgnify:CR=1 FL=1
MIETYTFPNGFRIVYQKSSNNIPVSHIYAFCDVGPVYEPDELRGVSHFIEHMCFKGTNKIPKVKNLLSHYDRIGAYFNAYTETRYTTYTLKCDDNYMENSLKIMSDMILNSKFDEKEFRKEEMVVIEENIKDSDELIQQLNDEMNSIIYKGSSFEYPIDNIKYHKNKYNYEKVLDFYNNFYQPNRIVLSIISNISFEQFKKYLKQTFFVKKESKCGILPIIQFHIEPQDDIKIKLIPKKKTNTTHFFLGFRTQTVDKYILNTLRHILSSTFNSRLYSLLREKEGLTYTSRAFVDYNEIYGGFYIYAETDKTKILKNGKSKKGVFPIVIDLLENLIKNGVTQEELNMTKGYLHGSFNMALANNDRIVTHNGTRFLLHPNKKIVPFIDLYDIYYKNISKEQLDNVIKKYFVPNGMFICMVGDNLPSEKMLYKICNKLEKK